MDENNEVGLVIEGSEEFKASFTETPAAEAAPEEVAPQQIPLTVDKDGNIVGGLEGLDQGIIDQLSSPESQTRIARLYKDHKYGNEPPPKKRFIHENVATIAEHQIAIPPRDLRKHNAPGLTPRMGRKLRRQHQRKLQKIENQSGMFRKEIQSHGRKPDESNAGNGIDNGAEQTSGDGGQA